MRPSGALLTFAVLAALHAPVHSLAHEGGIDARGTVTEVTPRELVLRTAAGDSKRFAVIAETEVRRGSTAARIQDVRIGERVVVHGRKSATGAVAVSIRLPGSPGEPGSK